MAYGKSKDLTKRTQSDKVLRDKAFKIASDPKYDGYQRERVMVMNQIISWWVNLIGRLLGNSRDEKFIHLLMTIIQFRGSSMIQRYSSVEVSFGVWI